MAKILVLPLHAAQPIAAMSETKKYVPDERVVMSGVPKPPIWPQSARRPNHRQLARTIHSETTASTLLDG
jgi:hypothetical protein